MKYCVEKNLSVFEFHDAVFSLVRFDGKDLVISAAMLNIHKGTPQNPSAYDMEIEDAQITFRNFHSANYEPGRAWETDADGNSYQVGPRIILSGQDGIDQILKELTHKIWVYHLEKEETGGYSIGGCGTEPYFTIEFDFDEVTVCWDKYSQKAWYERHPFSNNG